VLGWILDDRTTPVELSVEATGAGDSRIVEVT
jgi:hypothetical protein